MNVIIRSRGAVYCTGWAGNRNCWHPKAAVLGYTCMLRVCWPWSGPQAPINHWSSVECFSGSCEIQSVGSTMPTGYCVGCTYIPVLPSIQCMCMCQRCLSRRRCLHHAVLLSGMSVIACVTPMHVCCASIAVAISISHLCDAPPRSVYLIV